MDTKIIEVEAETLEEAREQVKPQIPEGLSMLSEKIIANGKPKTMRAIADTTEAAFAKAQSEIPTSASILGKKELTAPEQKVTMVEAFDEQSAKARLKSQFGDTAIIKALKLTTSGKQGFLGIGKKPNQYEAEVFQQAIVEIIYKTKAKISAIIGVDKIPSLLNELTKTPVNITTTGKLLKIIDDLVNLGDSRAIAPLTKLEQEIARLIFEVDMEIAKGQTGGGLLAAMLPSALKEMNTLRSKARSAIEEIRRTGQKTN